LGLPPRPVVEKEHLRRQQETELVTACRTKRIADVQRLLNMGVDPDTLTFMPGAALRRLTSKPFDGAAASGNVVGKAVQSAAHKSGGDHDDEKH
jgi:hypothetical protein